MHDELNPVRRLYDEPGSPGTPPGTHAADLSGAEAEYEALRPVKEALDALPPRRPDPATLDAVVAAAAEAVRLRPLEEALGQLPRQRPDASVLDAVVAAAAEAAHEGVLAPVRAAYGESVPLATPGAEQEAARLAEMKAALEALPRQRPDASVLDAVVAAAAEAAKPTAAPLRAPARAVDRAARRPRRRVAAMLSTALALVLVFATAFWLMDPAETPEATFVAAVPDATMEPEAPRDSAADAAASSPQAESTSEAPAPAPAVTAEPALAVAEAAARPAARRAEAARQDLALTGSAEPEATEGRAGVGVAAARWAEERAVPQEALPVRLPRAFVPPPAAFAEHDGRLAEQNLPLSDGDEALRNLYLRLEAMQAQQAGLGWDAPPVSVGAPPASALQQPTSGWMRVRVER